MTDGYHAPSPLAAAVRGLCPRCGEGRMFAGFLKVAARCNRCGLDLRREDSGDGPVAFIILIVGFVVFGLMLWVEVSYRPPSWVHALLWLPLSVVLILALMRPMKGLMVALQYRHRREDYESP